MIVARSVDEIHGLGEERHVVVLAHAPEQAVVDAVPRLCQLAESFTYGQWCSVCSPDYTPCFEQAVSIIDTSCDEFDPPG